VLNVIKMEHSFIYGLTETFSNNLDFVFRYLYQVFFMMQVGLQMSDLFNDYVYVGTCLLLNFLIVFTFIANVLSYRKRVTHISQIQAIFFYFTCKCFKSKQVLENYIE